MNPRTKKILLAVVGIVAVGALVAVGGAYMLVSKLRDPQMLADWLQGVVGPSLQGKIEIKELAWEPISAVRVGGIQTAQPAFAEKPLFKCDKLRVAVELSELLSGHLAIKEIKISGWQVNIQRNPDGAMNLPAMSMSRAALALPDLQTALLATAAAIPAKGLSVSSIVLEGGEVGFEDKISSQAVKWSGVAGQLSFSDGKLRVTGVTGKVLETQAMQLTGEVQVLPSFSTDLKLDLKDLDAKTLQEHVNFLKGLSVMGGSPWSGSIPAKVQIRVGPGKRDVEAKLGFTNLSISDPVVTQQTMAVSSGSGLITVKMLPANPVSGALDLQFQRTVFTPLGQGMMFPLDGLTVGVDFTGQQLNVREIEGRVGGGSMTAKGTLQGIFGELDVQGQNLALTNFFEKTTVLADHPWAHGAILKKMTGKYSPGQFSFSELEAIMGGATISASGAVRAGANGYEPAGVNGTAELDESMLGSLFGFKQAGRVGGKASVKFTLQPQAFTSEFRTNDFSIRGTPPELTFRALAANFNGLRQQRGGQMQVAWSANVRSGPFTMLWPKLMQAAMLPVEGPIKFDTGEASLMYDTQGLHVMSLKAVSPKVTLSAKMLLAPGGEVSGDMDMEAYAAPGLPAVKNSSVLSGTLSAPKLSPR